MKTNMSYTRRLPIPENPPCTVELYLDTLSVVKKKHRCWTRYMDTKSEKAYQEYCRSKK